MSGFQKTINANPAPAVEGDFASANPMASMLALAGGLVACAAGVTVGRFAFAKNSDQTVSNQHPGVACRLGFVQRDQPGVLITTFLGQASMVQLAGYGTTLFSKGEFWGRFNATAGQAGGAAIGQKVYACYYDGQLLAAATASAPTDNTFRVSTTNTSTTVTITTPGAEPIAPGMPISGAGIPAGATVVSYGTSTGGVGTIVISAAATATAAGVVLTATLAVETNWTVDSACNAGELAQISTNG